MLLSVFIASDILCKARKLVFSNPTYKSEIIFTLPPPCGIFHMGRLKVHVIQ